MTQKIADLKPYQLELRSERAKRLREIIDADFNGIQKHFAEKLNTSYSYIGDVLACRSNMGEDMLKRLEKLGYDANYIATGIHTPTEKELLEKLSIKKEDIQIIDNEFYIPISVISRVLGASQQSINHHLNQNREDFGVGSYKLNLYPYKTAGGTQRMYFLVEAQFYILMFLMNKNEKARQFRKDVSILLQNMRQGKIVTPQQIQIEHQQEKQNLLIESAEWQLKYICKQMHISSLSLRRYKELRKLALSSSEAGRAVKIPLRTAARIDKVTAKIDCAKNTLLQLGGSPDLFQLESKGTVNQLTATIN